MYKDWYEVHEAEWEAEQEAREWMEAHPEEWEEVEE